VKLIFIITGTGVGGAETMLQKVLMRLSPEFKPHVISMIPVGKIGERLRALGIPVESLDMRRGGPNPIALMHLIRRLRDLRPDVVHTWMYHADLMGGVAARLAGVPAVAWAIRHSNLAPAVNKSQTLAVVRANAFLSHRVPDRILCCSDAARNIHVALGYAPEKLVVVPNGFDLAHFKPDPNARLSVRAELGLSLETRLVGLIGRWHPQKNHVGFLSAVAAVHLRRPDVHFLLVGQGVDAANQIIQRTLAANSLTPATHLLGQRDDIPRIMAALDVLASSSYGEAFPNVLGEAMASGAPCAVTDVGDSAYIVGDTGRIVSSGDMEGLAHAIGSLLEMPVEALRMLGARARARVAEHFEIGKIVRRYEAFYEELAAVRRNKRRDPPVIGSAL
jgi:glycosyltransferase involved in cell wall biosynthesis